MLIVVIGLPVLLVVAVAVIGIMLGSGGERGPAPDAGRAGELPMPPVPAPAAASPECGALLGALPAVRVNPGG